jgi:hypothetical protein
VGCWGGVAVASVGELIVNYGLVELDELGCTEVGCCSSCLLNNSSSSCVVGGGGCGCRCGPWCCGASGWEGSLVYIFRSKK